MTKLNFTYINFIIAFAIVVELTMNVISFLEFEKLASASNTFNAHALALLVGSAVAVATTLIALWALNRESKRARQAAAQSEKFTSLVKNSSDIIMMANLDREIEYMNPAGHRILGVSPDAIIGTASKGLYTEAANQRIREEILPSAQAKGLWSGDFQYQNFETKEMIPVLLNVVVLKDSVTGEPTGLAAVSRDIRDRIDLEKKIDRFFEVSLDMLVISNAQGYFVKINPSVCTTLGYTHHELCSRPVMDFLHPDDIAPTIAEIGKLSKGITTLSFENRYRTKSGEYRWLSWKAILDGDLFYGAARDITEERRQKSFMETLNREAIAASLAKSEFLANMSHEIRTPLNGVIGMTGLVLDTKLDPEQRAYAETISNSAEALLTIVNDILDFSKVEAGKLDLEELDFNLEELVDETAKMLQFPARNKSLELRVKQTRTGHKLVRGDAGRVRQILMNLVSNAIKFTAKGSVEIEVAEYQTFPTSTEYRFTVTDTGIGLSHSELKKMFQAFTQADASTTRKYGGTGLGLSISKKLVEIMGGEIGVESVENQGSTFWFTIPLEHSKVAKVETKDRRQNARTQFENAQILVAEDNIVNQKILLAMLAKMGFKAQAVANGAEVLSILKDVHFDLILMDCQMPVLDGYEATVRIRESKTLAHPEIPIVAMTANALKGDRERCLGVGMNDYATKPIELGALVDVIDKCLTEHSPLKPTVKSSSAAS